jgi:prepilin-type N-terminal cleavage/methylation domain-containing protein
MNKKGVTLIELIVVMVIIAIGAALFVPNIGGFLPSYRLRSGARNIVSTMRTAQMKAVSTNMTYRVSFTTTTYILQYENPPGTWVNEGNTKTLPTGISISAVNLSSGNNAIFNPNSTSSSGSLTLKNKRGTTSRLLLTPSTGRVKIKTP